MGAVWCSGLRGSHQPHLWDAGPVSSGGCLRPGGQGAEGKLAGFHLAQKFLY